MFKSDMVVRYCNPSTLKAVAGGSWVPDQPGIYSKTLSQKKKKKEKEKKKKKEMVLLIP
jgi:hypothetical protein